MDLKQKHLGTGYKFAIKGRMEKVGATSTALGNVLGCAPSRVQFKIEEAESLTLTEFDRLCEALGTSPVSLLSEAEAVRAAFVIRDLYARYGINDPNQAKRLVRERFSQAHLELYEECRAILDHSGRLG